MFTNSPKRKAQLTHVLFESVGVVVFGFWGVLAAESMAFREQPRTQVERTGRELYQGGCAACHSADGTGSPISTVGFDIPLPDFTDCRFASREPDGDWLAVAHQGGPVRAFDRMMPAFGEVLTEDEILLALGHIRTFCEDKSWPRGELNLPRALVTEKAFPEDEMVLTVTTAAEGDGSVTPAIVYERRFGSRNQIEIKVPFTFEGRNAGSWRGGIGDITLGYKRNLFYSLRTGSIFSVAGEVILPTGNEDRGFGKGVTVFEPFVAFGQMFPADGFMHLQAGLEIPADRDRADEAFWGAAVGKTIAQDGGWGRAWSPIVELLGARDLDDDAPTHWDLVPQVQFSLSQRQHVLMNVGVRLPLTYTGRRRTEVMVYVLWDWFDGGLFAGW